MTKKHHYVWQKYLKPWTQEGQIWTMRQENIFPTSTENIAQKRFFYETFALNNSEINLISELIKRSHPSAYQTLYATFRMFLDITYGNEQTRKTGLEDYHSEIEGSSTKYIEAIFLNDFSFMEDDRSRNNFCYFVGLQFTRTKRQFDNLVESFEKMRRWPQYSGFMTELNSNSVAKAYQLISAEYVGNWLSGANIKFVSVTGNIRLLTSDQPVFNLSAIPKGATEPPSEMNLFYPLSPNLAMLASTQEILDTPFDSHTVNRYNELIRANSHEQIFALSREDLTL